MNNEEKILNIENSRSFCIYCKKRLNTLIEDQSQYHVYCWDAIKCFQYDTPSEQSTDNKIYKIVRKIYFFVNIDVYHGLIINNIGFLGSISKKSLTFSVFSYFSILGVLFYLLN